MFNEGPYKADKGVFDTSEFYRKETCDLSEREGFSKIDERNLGMCKELLLQKTDITSLDTLNLIGLKKLQVYGT